MSTDGPDKTKVTYQPYVFALSFLALLAKSAVSFARGDPALDYLFGVFVAVFIVSSVLYYVSYSKARKRANVDVQIETGKIRDADLTGADVSNEADARVNIATSDVNKSRIVGFRQGDQ